MMKKYQQMKEEFSQRWEKVSQWVGKPFLWCAKIVTSIQFLCLLLLVFSLALYHAPLADFLLSIVTEEDKKDSTKIIPFVPVIATILGFLLFAQRLDVMNKQAELTQSQHEAEQFKQACELLGHEKMVTRMGGITILNALARTDPETWHIKAVDALANFIRDRSAQDKKSPVKKLSDFFNPEEKDEKEAKEKRPELYEFKLNNAPDDIRTAMSTIARRLTIKQKAVVQEHLKTIPYWPDLRESWLSKINLTGAYLPRVNLSASFLSQTYLPIANLSGALFRYSHSDGILLAGSTLQDTNFDFSNLSNAEIEGATGLEKDALVDCYYIDGKRPPILPDGITMPEPISVTDYLEKFRDIY